MAFAASSSWIRPGVRQHDPAEVLRARRAEDTSAEPVRDEPRQIADVIEVGVRQHDGVDLGRGDRQILPVALAQLLQPLEQPGVDQNLLRAGVEQILRAGYRARGAEECQRQGQSESSLAIAVGIWDQGSAIRSLNMWLADLKPDRRPFLWQCRRNSAPIGPDLGSRIPDPGSLIPTLSTSREQSHLPTRVPEEDRLIVLERAGPDSRDQACHRFGGVGRVEKQPLRAGEEL